MPYGITVKGTVRAMEPLLVLSVCRRGLFARGHCIHEACERLVLRHLRVAELQLFGGLLWSLDCPYAGAVNIALMINAANTLET